MAQRYILTCLCGTDLNLANDHGAKPTTAISVKPSAVTPLIRDFLAKTQLDSSFILKRLGYFLFK